MKVAELKRIPPPKPTPPKKVCIACKAYAAECEVPHGDGALDCCWLCAHLIVEHNCDPTRVIEWMDTECCEHAPDEIYPDRRVLALLNGHLYGTPLRFEHGDVTHEQIKNATHETMHLYNQKTGNIDTIVVIPFRQKLVDEAREKIEALSPAERKALRAATKNPRRC